MSVSPIKPAPPISTPVGPAKVSEIDWDATLRSNQNWLRTVIAARVGEPAAVDEVWQEVSLAAFQQKAPLQDVTKVAPWLYRIAVTQSLMYRRKMGRRRKLMDRYVQRYEPTEEDTTEANPLDWLLAQERQAMVRDAMERLPQRDRETLMLKYVHNWSYKEMADKLGSTVPAIQAKLHRARQRLREELATDSRLATANRQMVLGNKSLPD
ncbi:MAG: RNA polymerase sigma factor [Thermoguttaceae bacterium]